MIPFRFLAAVLGVLLLSRAGLASEEESLKAWRARQEQLNELYKSVTDMDKAKAAVPVLKAWYLHEYEEGKKEQQHPLSKEGMESLNKQFAELMAVRKVEFARIIQNIPDAPMLLNGARNDALREAREKDLGLELPIVNALHAYADGQDKFRRTDWDNNGILEYATTLAQLQHDAAGKDLGFISADIANADCSLAKPVPFKGYLFKVLTAQVNPSGVASPFVPKDSKYQVMGYGLLAYPAVYGEQKKTFQICSSGTVFAKDLGPETPTKAKAIDTFDYRSWEPVE